MTDEVDLARQGAHREFVAILNATGMSASGQPWSLRDTIANQLVMANHAPPTLALDQADAIIDRIVRRVMGQIESDIAKIRAQERGGFTA